MSLEIIAFIGVGFQGILLSFLLFIDSRSKSNATKVLSILMFAFSLEILNYTIMWTESRDKFFQIGLLTYGFALVYGPLFLLYLRLRYRRRFSNWFYLQFIPYIIQTAFLVPYYFLDTPSSDALSDFYSTNYYIRFFEIAAMISTTVYVWIVVFEVGKIMKTYELDKKNRLWLRSTSSFFALYVISYNYFWVMYLTMGMVNNEYLITATMAASIYLIGYFGYFKPELVGKFYLKKYQKSSLDKAHSQDMVDQLVALIETDHIYLDPNLSLTKAATSLNTSTHFLSQVVNQSLNQSFSDLINTKRIEKAKQLLSDPANFDEKLISIAFSSGFNSKTNFYLAFKKITGVSPSEYRESYRVSSVTSN